MVTTFRARPRRRALTRFGSIGVAVALLLTGCTSDDPKDEGSSADGTPSTDTVVVPGTQEVSVTGVGAKTPVTLLDADGKKLLTLISDDAGQAHFAYIPTEHLTLETGGENVMPTDQGESLKPGTYTVAVGEGDDAEVSDPFAVGGIDDHPEKSFYEKQDLTGFEMGILGVPAEGSTVEDGYQYLEMRDGTMLSAMVRFPDEAIYGAPPYPTVIEYSGYDSIANPDAEEPGSRIARALGFATVGIAMRGTGCSGGAFDVFSPAQQADGYDSIEIVASQNWVKNNKVGMVGLSYSGIAQLFAASTAPPSLAAILPQSVIVDPWLAQWPGGVYNNGFTKQWLAERDRQAAAGGVGWVTERTDSDETCRTNLELRSQNIDFESFGRSIPNRPIDASERDLRQLVRKIDVPVLLTGAFQDEQTGPFFTGILDHFDASPLFRARMWNGRHPDGYSPVNLEEWFEFLALYVDETVPKMNPLVRDGLAPELAKNFGLTDITLDPERLADQFGDDYDAALAFYEAEAPIQIVFENGAGGNEPGDPGGTFTLSFDSWPTPTAERRTWYLGPDGTLTDTPAAAEGADSYLHDPDAGQEDFFGPDGYQLFPPTWDIDWTQFPAGRSLSYVTEPLAEDLVLGGPGAVTLWFGSEAADADVQVTITEVRPDGNEVLLQSAWLRLSHRAIDEASTDGLRIEHTYLAEDVEPLPPGELVEAQLAMSSVGAPLRAGSRLRVQVATPGRNHGTWLFESPHDDGEEPAHTVGRGGATPSAITLSVLPGVSVPPAYPDCIALRGQPCRTYESTANTPAAD